MLQQEIEPLKLEGAEYVMLDNGYRVWTKRIGHGPIKILGIEKARFSLREVAKDREASVGLVQKDKLLKDQALESFLITLSCLSVVVAFHGYK